MKLVLASRNAHKLTELGALLADHELIALPAEVEMPPETETTFAANARTKARVAARATGRAALADDSGIEAAALGGAPGVRSARFAGEGASDEENLAKLLLEVPREGDRRVAYVCALAFADPEGLEHVVEGRCEGMLADAPRGSEGFGYDPAFLPDDSDDGRTMAELAPGEKAAIGHRGRAARDMRAWLDSHVGSRPGTRGGRAAILRGEPMARVVTGGPRPLARGFIGPEPGAPRRTRAAAVSIASNAVLIVLKLVAGLATGSIAIITEAVHSSIDLLASLIAYYSVRKAEEPADKDHPYGHEKVENLSAAVEGVLILVGAAVIVSESIRRLLEASPVERLGFGIAVIALSIVANVVVSSYLYRQARISDSPALEGDAAHLRADALTSIGVLVALVLVELTGAQVLDPAAALVVAGAIVVSGLRIISRSSRVLVDEALPEEELAVVRDAVDSLRASEVEGFHKLRARRAGSRRYIDLHLQFRPGTTLERAHAVTHDLESEIRARIRGADVLIHLEPATPAPRPRKSSPVAPPF